MTRWNTNKSNPTEYQEQCKLAEYLDMKGHCWIHVPNGGNRDAKNGAKMKKQGVKPGVPDVLIFDVPDNDNCHKGIAIELKRQKGGRVSKYQDKWLGMLSC